MPKHGVDLTLANFNIEWYNWYVTIVNFYQNEAIDYNIDIFVQFHLISGTFVELVEQQTLLPIGNHQIY